MRIDRNSLILRWLALAVLILFIVMALRTSENAVIYGRYSQRYFIYLITALGSAITFFLFSARKFREKVVLKINFEITQKKKLIYFSCVLLILLFLYPFSRYLSQKMHNPFEVNYLISLLSIIFLIVTIFLLLRFRFFHSEFFITWRLVVLFLGIYLVVTLVLFFGDLPTIDPEDEPFTTGNSLLNFAKFGEFPSLRPGERNAGNWLNNPFLWVISGAFQNYIGVGWLEARAFYLLVGLLACPFIFYTASQLYGRIAGWAAALLAVSIPLQYNWARAEIWVAVATSIAIFCLFRSINSESKHPSYYSYFCGFFIASTIDGHFYGIAFIITFCLLYLLQLFQPSQKSRSNSFLITTSFFVGCVSYMLFWFWYHIYLPGIHLHEVSELFANNYAWEMQVSSVKTKGVIRIIEHVIQTLQHYFRKQTHEFFLLIFVLVATMMRKEKHDFTLLFIFGGSVVVFFAIIAHPNQYYYIFLMPFLSIWFGKLVQMINEISKSSFTNKTMFLSNGAILTLVLVLAIYTGRATEMAFHPENVRNISHLQEMIWAGRELNSKLPNEDVVIAGHFPFYLGMTNRLNYVGRYFAEPIVSLNNYPEDLAALIVLISDQNDPATAKFINSKSFVVIACIPLSNMDSLFGFGENREFVAALFVHPKHETYEHTETCTSEMLNW